MGAEMIPCSYPWFPIPYGCFCGVELGPEDQFKPMDEFDEACRIHDHCYDDALKIPGCEGEKEYIHDYKWSKNGTEIICDPSNDPCGKALCHCDSTVITKIAKESKKDGCRLHDIGCNFNP